MGNLRSKYTDEEWNNLEKRIEKDKKDGKPEEMLFTLSLWNKDVEQLKKLRGVLSDFYDKWELELLDQWIKWKSL